MTAAAATRDDSLARAYRLLETVPLVDGHNDLPWLIRVDSQAKGDIVVYDPMRTRERSDTDIPRLRAGRVSAQFWSAFIPTKTKQPARATMELIDVILRLEETYPDVFLPGRRAADILEAKRTGKIASFMTVEGGVGLENSLSPLRIWYAAGARMMTLCHNETLDWVDSTTDTRRHGGLTEFGRAVVRELNRLGIFVDCAHVSQEVMRQVLDISAAPIVMSHSNAFALCDHPRNVPDDVLARLRDNGGLVMATFVPHFIVRRKERGSTEPDPPPATLERLVDHIVYLADKAGIDHVGIGSDFFGGPSTAGLEDVSRFPHLLAELLRRGWSDGAVAKIAGGNFIRAFEGVEAASQRLRAAGPPAVGRIEDFGGAVAS